ncbi:MULTISPECIES: hypothetical protein [unclassified Streptomyces]|uniref:hypothetical protein n=1 Tax=unclassified Streptomyces TaxID=2593676 RepID=UPI0040433AC6
MRTAVHATASATAACLTASDVPAAQDAVNAALGCLPRRAPDYCLFAYAALGLPKTAQDLLAQRAEDEQRIRRLRFLKDNLYDHRTSSSWTNLSTTPPAPWARSILPNSSALPA